MAIPVRELLDAPVLRGARLIGGRDGLGREVSWTSVIEWQAVQFVRPGELVLTTGVGLEEPTLTHFLGQLLQSDAAAVALSLLPGGPVACAPADAVREADRRGVPLIDLPWDVGFADVGRWVVDELIRRRFAGSVDAPDAVYARFADALLGGQGMEGIAAALEGALERPVLVFDARLQLAGHGPLADGALGDAGLRELRLRAASLPPAEARALAARFDAERPCRLDGLGGLGLGPGTGRAAVARHDTLGFLYVLDGDGHVEPLPNLELRALDQAAASVAIEGLRRRSAAYDEARDDFLWQLVSGLAGPPDHVLARAAVLGFDARMPHELAVARCPGGDGVAARPALDRLARELRARAARAPVELAAAVRDDAMVVIAACAEGEPGRLRRLVDEAQAAAADAIQGVSWGIAATARRAAELDRSYAEAERALEVGRTLHGPGSVADAGELGELHHRLHRQHDGDQLHVGAPVVRGEVQGSGGVSAAEVGQRDDRVHDEVVGGPGDRLGGGDALMRPEDRAREVKAERVPAERLRQGEPAEQPDGAIRQHQERLPQGQCSVRGRLGGDVRDHAPSRDQVGERDDRQRVQRTHVEVQQLLDGRAGRGAGPVERELVVGREQDRRVGEQPTQQGPSDRGSAHEARLRGWASKGGRGEVRRGRRHRAPSGRGSGTVVLERSR